MLNGNPQRQPPTPRAHVANAMHCCSQIQRRDVTWFQRHIGLERVCQEYLPNTFNAAAADEGYTCRRFGNCHVAENNRGAML
eukprot:2015183-Amphidinium_carterae.1